jgi:hypothetical protein
LYLLAATRADHGFRHGLNILSMFADAIVPILCDWSYSLLTRIPIVGSVSRPTMGSHASIKETIMANNQGSKGKGRKDQGNQQNSDLASGPGDNAQRGDWGSQQSGRQSQGNQSQSDLASGPGDNSQRSNQGQSRQSGNLSQSRQSGNLNRNQQSDNQAGSMQSGGQGSRTSRNQLDQDDLDSDESLER